MKYKITLNSHKSRNFKWQYCKPCIESNRRPLKKSFIIRNSSFKILSVKFMSLLPSSYQYKNLKTFTKKSPVMEPLSNL